MFVDQLSEGEMSIDEISLGSKFPVQNLLSTLLGLEIKRVVKQLPGKRFVLI
jgi:predicted Rossmann fold nucleotide-binding protein DprA/Smf involved in DNA uptake